MKNPLRILVVDDDIVCQIVLRAILEKLGHHATTVNNGIEAINIFKKHDFDFAFIDLYMPGITGDETAKHIKQISSNREKNIKIFITTAHDLYSDSSFDKSCIDGTLSKPICKETITQAIAC